MAIVGRFSALYINQSVTKNFSIETLLEMTDSTSPSLFMLETVLSGIVSIVSIGKYFVMDRFMYSAKRR